MQLGLSTNSYHLAFGCHKDFKPTEPIRLDQCIDTLVALDLNGLVIDPRHLNTHESGFPGKIRKRLEDHGLFAEYGVERMDLDDIESGIDICRLLGAELLRVRLGFDRFSPGIRVEKELERAREILLAATGLLEQSGVKLAVEYRGDATGGELADLIEKVGSPHVGVCLDVGNHLCVLEEPMQALLILLPYAFTIQFRDYTMALSLYGCKTTCAALGQGVLPLAEMLGMIQIDPRHDRIVLHVPIEGTADTRASLAREDQAVRESVRYCKETLGIGSHALRR